MILGIKGLKSFSPFREPISGRKLLDQAYTFMAHTKAWTGYRNWNGVAVFGWNASLSASHVTYVLERLDYFLYALVSILFFIPGAM